MNVLPHIFLIFLVIAALQGLAIVLAGAIVLALIIGLFRKPQETIGLMIVLGSIAAIQAHPGITIGVAGGLLAIVWIVGAAKGRTRASVSAQRQLPRPDGENP